MADLCATFDDTVITSDQFDAALRSVPAGSNFDELAAALAKRLATKAIADIIYPWLKKAGAWMCKQIEAWWDYLGQ